MQRAGLWTPILLLFQFELGLVFFKKHFQLIGGSQESISLFVIEGHGKPTESIDADAAFFADGISIAPLRFSVSTCFSAEKDGL